MGSEQDYTRIKAALQQYSPPHGTRAAYLRGVGPERGPGKGCRCRACRVANAAYLQRYRQLRRAGTVLLGAKIAADNAKRLIEQLRREDLTKTAIAHALGLRSPGLKVQNRITVRRLLKIKRVHRRYFSEASE